MAIPNTWQAVLEDNTWKVRTEDGRLIATIEDSSDAEDKAKLIASSPYMLEALKAAVDIMGEEDLPDNGELSGAAVSDLVRSAVMLAD